MNSQSSQASPSRLVTDIELGILSSSSGKTDLEKTDQSISEIAQNALSPEVEAQEEKIKAETPKKGSINWSFVGKVSLAGFTTLAFAGAAVSGAFTLMKEGIPSFDESNMTKFTEAGALCGAVVGGIGATISSAFFGYKMCQNSESYSEFLKMTGYNILVIPVGAITGANRVAQIVVGASALGYGGYRLNLGQMLFPYLGCDETTQGCGQAAGALASGCGNHLGECASAIGNCVTSLTREL